MDGKPTFFSSKRNMFITYEHYCTSHDKTAENFEFTAEISAIALDNASEYNNAREEETKLNKQRIERGKAERLNERGSGKEKGMIFK